MKKNLPAIAAFLALALIALTLKPERNSDAFDTTGFGQLPVLANGRVQPLDTVARTSLLLLQGRQRVTSSDGRTVTSAEWLLDMAYRQELADGYAVIEIVHPDLLALLHLAPTDGVADKRFTIRQLAGNFQELDRQSQLADEVDTAARTPYQRAVLQLRNNLIVYQRLQNSFAAPGTSDFLAQLARVEAIIAAPAVPTDAASSQFIAEMNQTFTTLDSFSYLRPIPPESSVENEWRALGAAWSASLARHSPSPAAQAHAAIGRAWRVHDPVAFNQAIVSAADTASSDVRFKCRIEAAFNAAQPFYTSMVLYVIAFLCAVFSWLVWPHELARTAFGLIAIAFVLSSVGIGARMWLEARPPVTNLYSSALFVGWGAVALCLALEYVYKNAVGSVAAGLIGFAALLIAHHLSLSGDTLEMMRAVLDSNFWLATHVVTVTVGYSATFLAGFLALIYVARGVFTRSLDRATRDALARMVYGVVCFATLFSFVGTVLGGIWADQSWGRFWGWDPKENGALLIVIWNSVILHVRWGGLLQQRGLMALAIFGNIVTAWSWFGVNMLGVGLHSYGFMDAAFWWLIGFVAVQLGFVGLAMLPTNAWRSAVAIK